MQVGGVNTITLGGNVIEYDPKFKLYLGLCAGVDDKPGAAVAASRCRGSCK